MTVIEQAFKDAFPKAIDFPQADYEARKDEYDQAAAGRGYRLAGRAAARFCRVENRSCTWNKFLVQRRRSLI